MWLEAVAQHWNGFTRFTRVRMEMPLLSNTVTDDLQMMVYSKVLYFLVHISF